MDRSTHFLPRSGVLGNLQGSFHLQDSGRFWDIRLALTVRKSFLDPDSSTLKMLIHSSYD